MQIKKFKVQIYDWEVILIEINGKEDIDILKNKLKRTWLPNKWIDKTIQEISDGGYDGGHHYCNDDLLKSIIVILETSSDKERISTLCHEKRHLEDSILKNCDIDDIEAASFLAGYLGKKMLI